jgi:hypothetical protein
MRACNSMIQQRGVTHDEPLSLRISFQQRVNYHRQLIRFEGPTTPRFSGTVRATAGILWDMQHILLELLLDFGRRGRRGWEERASIVQYLWSEYNDTELQQNIVDMSWPEQRTGSIEEEVTTFLSHQIVCVRLLRIALSAPTILQSLSSLEAQEIAQEQLLRGSSHPLLLRAGDAFDVFTWTFVLNLGITGLVYRPERTPKGRFQVSKR